LIYHFYHEVGVILRAIIAANTSLTNNELISVLNEIDWAPNKNLSGTQLIEMNELIQSKTRELLNSSSTVYAATVFYTIFEGKSETWGIVSRPNQTTVIFQLDNASLKNLKNGCRSLVKVLRLKFKYKLIKYLIDHKINSIDFSSVIKVSESNRDVCTLKGEILHKYIFLAVLQERTTQFYTALIAGILTILVLYITSPISPVNVSNYGIWGIWAGGYLVNASTAPIFPFIVSIMEFFVHWSILKRKYPIKWTD
jgi:hypothetical protein